MATEDFEDLSDDEIEARQRALDGEDTTTDPTVGDEPEAGAAEEAGAAAEVTTEGTEAAAAEAATTEAAAEKPAGAEAEPKVEGVQSKDGTRVLPYGALQAARRDARRAESRAERAEREAAELKQQIEDLKAGKTPGGEELTEEKVAEMEADFPEEGRKLRAAFNRIQELEAKVPKAEASQDDDADNPTQEAIDQVPLLLEWQHGDPEKFVRAQEIDSVLMKSPKWAGKPAVARFEQVARMVADEYDIAYPEPKSSTNAPAAATAKPADPAAQAQRKPPETLSDFKGGSVADHGSIDVKRMTAPALLDRMQGMSDDEIDAHLAKYGG